LKSPAEPLSRLARTRTVRAAVLAFAIGGLVAASAARAAAALPDKAAAAALLDRFRSSLYAEPVYIEFELREMPRRGAERLFRGRLWGARNERGPVSRLEVATGAGRPVHSILVQGGPEPALWVSDGPGAGTRDEKALLQPLVGGVEMTPFDLQMPFLYWLDVDLAGEERVRGRPAYVYVFAPSADFAAANPGIRSVKAYLDTQYDALMQSEIAGANGRPAKTLSLLELRKVGDRWIPRDVDVRNEATRDKTRLSVTAIAIGVPLDPSAFDPSVLGAAAASPPAASVTPITQ
jgi:hypothetical protein